MPGTHTAKAEADLPVWTRSHYLDRMTLREPVAACFQPFSRTVFNLGRDKEGPMSRPWGEDLSGGIAIGRPRRRALAEAIGVQHFDRAAA